MLPPGISKVEVGLALRGFITVARIILRHWKSQTQPEFIEWVKLMTDNASFELMIAWLNDNKGTFDQVLYGTIFGNSMKDRNRCLHELK